MKGQADRPKMLLYTQDMHNNINTVSRSLRTFTTHFYESVGEKSILVTLRILKKSVENTCLKFVGELLSKNLIIRKTILWHVLYLINVSKTIIKLIINILFACR